MLIDPVTFRPGKAAAVTGSLVEHVRDALADAGDTGLVTDLLDAVLYRGNGAAAQRSEYQRRGRLVDVITAAATTTTGGPARTSDVHVLRCTPPLLRCRHCHRGRDCL